VQLNKLQDLAYGEMNGQPSPRTDALDTMMRDAGFDARLSPTIQRDMWEKWVLLATLGGICCLMRGNIGQVEAAPNGAEFALAFLDEVTAIVTAAGHPPTDAFLAGAKGAITQKGSPLTSSMYRDLLQGSPVEVDQILGDLLARGRALGVTTPLLAAAFAHLSVYQAQVAKP
jgi:2-dehydropantoate 2-reductase